MLRPLPGFRDFALEANHLTFFGGAGGGGGGKHHFRKKNFLQTDFERKKNLVRNLPYTVLLGRFHSTKTSGLKFSVK